MSELSDDIENSVIRAGQDTCYWTQDYCWHTDLEDCSQCPEKQSQAQPE